MRQDCHDTEQDLDESESSEAMQPRRACGFLAEAVEAPAEENEKRERAEPAVGELYESEIFENVEPFRQYGEAGGG